jgi:hypothetical protein
MPTIENDTGLICNALTDTDPYIRLQASAILTSIVIAFPEHNQVVVACGAGLIAAASDSNDQTRNNVLFSLAMNPAGPPPEARDTFVHALQSTNFRTSELGAAGLLKENSGGSANHALVRAALLSAPDAKHRLNLLYAIGGSNVPSESLFAVVQGYLYDSDHDVQLAAIDAVATTGPDPGKTAAVLENFQNSPGIGTEAKLHAGSALNRVSVTP